VEVQSEGLPRRPPGTQAKFQIPAEMAESPEVFDSTVDKMVELASMPGIPKEVALRGLKAFLKERGLSRFYPLWAANLRLMRFLVENGRDRVYRFVLKNSARPAFFERRRFDFVCGNPPWLSYRFVRDRANQERFKELVFRLGLLDRSETKLFAQMELATLFFAFSHKHYLKRGGTIAFVMPGSVLTGAKQHRNFQRGGFGFVRLID